MIILRRILAGTIMAIAGWHSWKIALLADDGSELSSGGLTGPMIGLLFLAAFTSGAAALIVPFHGKAGRVVFVGAWLLALPWASWIMFAGIWCVPGNCSGHYPMFSASFPALILILLPLSAWLLCRKT